MSKQGVENLGIVLRYLANMSDFERGRLIGRAEAMEEENERQRKLQKMGETRNSVTKN